MKRKYNLRIGFTVAVILFFFGAGFVASLHNNIVKGSNDNEFVEVIIQAYDLEDDNTYTLLLTKQQLRELQRIFDDLKNRLSTSTSIEDTQNIFNSTLVSMNRFNLLPNGMSIEQAQKLVTSTNQNTIPLIQKKSTKFLTDTISGTIQNSFCYIAGNTSNTHFAKPITRITMYLFDIMDYSSQNIILVRLSTALWLVFNPLSTISQTILTLQGNHYGASIFFGNFHFYPYPNWLFPAQGWISTNGINGKQNISGSFWGQKMTSGWQPQDDWYMNYSWRGCVGFTGFITYVDSDNAYYLGSALYVNVGPNRP